MALYKQSTGDIAVMVMMFKHRSPAKSCSGFIYVVVPVSPVLNDLATRSLTSPAHPQQLSLIHYFIENDSKLKL